jgi:hypothetical protein
LKSGQLRAGVEDLVRHHAGEYRALARQQRSEGVGGPGKKTESAGAVGVNRHETEFDPRHLPKKPRPDEKPEIPAQESREIID